MMVMGVMSASESNGMFLYTLGLTTWLLDTTPITEPSQNLLAAFCSRASSRDGMLR